MTRRRLAASPYRHVSAATVAVAACVSVATVSRVLNGIGGKASAETEARVRRIASELGYRPGRAGGALRQGRTRLVAVLAPNLANPAMAAVAASIEAALRQAQLVMVLCDTLERPDIQDEYLMEMRAQMVRATILLGAVASPHLQRLTAAGERLLFVNRRNPGGGTAAFIGIDNEQAGRDVAAFFLSRDLPIFGAIAASRGSSAVQARLAGFRACLRAVRPAPKLVMSTMADHVAAGRAGVARLLAQGASPEGGLFCASDLVAYGAARALALAGVPPGAVTIMGFDDNPLNDVLAPWLNSVRIPYEAFGPAVSEALTRMEANETPNIVLGHQLVVRLG